MSSRYTARDNGPRIIVYCVEPYAYQFLSTWAKRHDYAFILVVTTPGPARARSTGYREIIALAPPQQDILITTGMRRIAPLIAALEPDLIVSFTLPFRIPPDVTALPRYGAVNLHPAPLPRYRGPNPVRMIYDGESILAVTLHRTADEFDTGAILSQHTCPLPDDPTPESILAAWENVGMAAMDEGVARALAGDPGDPQDGARATHAAPFTDAETWLDWNVSAVTFQRRVLALNLFTVRARAMIEGQAYQIDRVTVLPAAAASPAKPPGTVRAWSGGTVTVDTADGLVRMVTTAL